MTNEETKKLCLDLIRADSEVVVVEILTAAGLWDDPECWRFYGDDELNWNRAGNQQGRTDFAINEKLVNTIDSRLMLECMLSGIAPEDPKAPRTMREAVNRFIEKTWTGKLKVSGGRVEEWPRELRKQVAESIAVFTTGPKGQKPCVNVADLGEGQTPDAFPETLLSLGKQNKIRVNFVQGKYGQGSTGAVRFCGRRKLQLIVSRRHPDLVGNPVVSAIYPRTDDDGLWGFSIVRREGEGLNFKTPFLTYLAPLSAKASPRAGKVLRFDAADMPLFPEGDRAYEREVAYGTLVKLYEYDLKNQSNILRRGGLRPKIDLLLPEPALPLRFHECRDHFKLGKSGPVSEQTETMSGLFARLNGNTNLEDAKPEAVTITAHGHELIARIFAFKPGSSDTYRNNEGVIFTINGQAQGYIKSPIFARKQVGLQRLAKDLLVILDCSELNAIEQHDMFMPSRDRLVDDNPFAIEIEKQLMIALKEHQGLRDLRNERAKQDVDDQLADNKPLEDVLKRVLKSSPTLARLFGLGQRLQTPFKPDIVQPSTKPFEGKPHPTFFRFSGKEQGATLARSAHLERRVRLQFETDVVDDYFYRKVDRGEKAFAIVKRDQRIPIPDYVGPNLSTGRGSLTFDLPEGTRIGDVVEVEFTVHDPVLGSEFRNLAHLAILAAAEDPPGPKVPPKPRPDQPPSPQGVKGNAGIALPELHWVKRTSANWASHFSTPDDCLAIVDDSEGSTPDWKFYLNEDNKALQSELKLTNLPAQVVRKQFEIGIVLIGMAVLHDDKVHHEAGGKPSVKDEEDSVERRVLETTRAVAPIVLPMIQSLGDLATDEVDESDLVGQAA